MSLFCERGEAINTACRTARRKEKGYLGLGLPGRGGDSSRCKKKGEENRRGLPAHASLPTFPKGKEREKKKRGQNGPALRVSLRPTSTPAGAHQQRGGLT